MTAHPSGPDIMAAWRAGFTRRWHTNPDMAQFDDTVCGHSGRVAVLAVMLFPSRIAVMRAAVLHDLGDMNGDTKRRNPDLAAMLDRLEDAAVQDMGLPFINLTVSEARCLHLCDWLDAWLFMMLRAPHLAGRDDWLPYGAKIRALADDLGVGNAVARLMGSRRGGVRFADGVTAGVEFA
jgi:hypothetical protein